jgi:bifunctional non-homologous end joining protein LigD
VNWSQVRPGLDPKRYTVRSVPAILAKSTAWADYDRAGRSFFAAAKKLAK